MEQTPLICQNIMQLTGHASGPLLKRDSKCRTWCVFGHSSRRKSYCWSPGPVWRLFPLVPPEASRSPFWTGNLWRTGFPHYSRFHPAIIKSWSHMWCLNAPCVEDRNAVLHLMRELEEPASRNVHITVRSVSMVIGTLTVQAFGYGVYFFLMRQGYYNQEDPFSLFKAFNTSILYF